MALGVPMDRDFIAQFEWKGLFPNKLMDKIFPPFISSPIIFSLSFGNSYFLSADKVKVNDVCRKSHAYFTSAVAFMGIHDFMFHVCRMILFSANKRFLVHWVVLGI